METTGYSETLELFYQSVRQNNQNTVIFLVTDMSASNLDGISVWNIIRTPVILPYSFPEFPQSIQANNSTELKICHNRLFFHSNWARRLMLCDLCGEKASLNNLRTN
jgi:hypothetical protein